MGDTENSCQSKKRGALREISRDNPGLNNEEDSEQEGTFKKASEEVLATRRIVSVRRKPKAAPAPNPFAGIKLVAPTASVPINPTEKESVDEKAVSNDVDVKTEKGKEEEEEEEEEEEVCKEPEENKGTENDVETEAESKAEEKSEAESKADNEEKKEEVKAESADEEKKNDSPLNSFQQLSSSQNAFTNLSGTGFSTSTFSFGPIKTDGSGFGFGSGPLFGLKTDGAPSFGLGLSNNNNGSSSLFGGSGSGSSSSAAKSSEVAPMKEVEVETGEENEEAVFTADSILYEFTSTGWKERGKGEVKINVSKAEKEKARLVMRARGNYRLILNANVFPDMKFEAMDKKGLSFACLNSTGESSGGFSTFALKFRDRSVVEDFRSAVAAHRGKTAKPAVLKTPENSPKASDE